MTDKSLKVNLVEAATSDNLHTRGDQKSETAKVEAETPQNKALSTEDINILYIDSISL